MSKTGCFIHSLKCIFSSHKVWDLFLEVGPFQNMEHQVFRLCFNIQTETDSKSVKNRKNLKLHKKTPDLHPLNLKFTHISNQRHI